MSHTTTVKSVQIRDIDALRTTIQELQTKGVQIELREKARARMYYENQTRELGICDYVVHLPQSRYDVALVRQTDGSYAPAFDEYAGEVGRSIGATCPMPGTKEGKAQHAIGQLMQGYAKNAAINQARAQGYMVESVDFDAQQNVVLTLAV